MPLSFVTDESSESDSLVLASSREGTTMLANETTATPLNEDVVRTRAYLMWEADGRPFGREDHYWHLAMSEITTGAAGDRPRRAAAASAVRGISPCIKPRFSHEPPPPLRGR